MATVIQSNKQYTGTKVLPNIIDSISSTADKVAFLKKLYATVSNDTSYITSQNADALFGTLKAHRERVIADGGIVLSMAHTLRAIVFAAKNALSTANYSAWSPDFGLKLVGSTAVKMYDLSGRDLEASSGTMFKALDNNLNVVSTNATASMLRTSAFTGSAGIIIGSCSHDIDNGTSTLIRAPSLFQNAAGTGTQIANIENNIGNVARFSYTLASGTAANINYTQVGPNYSKYAGIVGLSVGSGSSYLYENGNQKATSATASKDLTGVAIYPGITISSANSFLNESWMINSTSQALAQALSMHLNKTAS